MKKPHNPNVEAHPVYGCPVASPEPECDDKVSRVFTIQLQCQAMAESVAKIASYATMAQFNKDDDWMACVRVHTRRIRGILEAVEKKTP